MFVIKKKWYFKWELKNDEKTQGALKMRRDGALEIRKDRG
jgi:hypothetical protein